MKRIFLAAVPALMWVYGCSQPPKFEQENTGKKVGGDCEDCAALFEYGPKKLSSADTLPDYKDHGPKMVVSGIIYQSDGKTPAANVILYIYHTDQKGIYPTKGNEKGWDKRHGYIRGWIKTDETGAYKFYTLRPGAYPGRRNPEHIHATVKEPNMSAYWIDEYLFEDDPILTAEEKAAQKKRGGKGVLSLTKDLNGTFIAHRDIILGHNIPGY